MARTVDCKNDPSFYSQGLTALDGWWVLLLIVNQIKYESLLITAMDDNLIKEYREMIRKFDEQKYDFINSYFDMIKQQQAKSLTFHIEQVNLALELNDWYRAHSHFMMAQFYASLLGIKLDSK